MRTRTRVRIVSFWLASLLIATSFVYNKNTKAQSYKATLANVYSASLAQLNEAMYDVSAELQKIVYSSSSNKMGEIAVNLSKRTAIAKTALASLPTGQQELDAINKFLSQVGDYAAYLSSKASNNQEITDSERQNLVKLRNIAEQLSQTADSGSTNFSQLESWQDDIDGTENAGSFGGSMAQAQDQMEDYPTLIYDGPFSDAIEQKTSKMLESEKEISKEQAKIIAASAVSKTVDELQFLSEENGKIEAYCFGSNDCYIAITKRGGYVLYFRKSRDIGNMQINQDQAVSFAKDYLDGYVQRLGGTFVSSYYFTDEGVCTINFAFAQGKTVCYTDLIKIGVAMDTGEIVLMESRGYLMNHYDRSIIAPKVSAEQAQKALCNTLSCKKVSLALIPTQSGDEVHCFEMLCDGIDAQEVLVYLNVTTLQEEQILILLKTDGGTLTK